MLSFLLLVHLLDDSFRWDAASAGDGNIPQPFPAPSIPHSPLAGLQEQVHSTKGSWRLLKMTKAGLAHLLL